ncbi:hypothetical protein ABPG72_008978 [Tetrahymena utriculariae]
MSRIQQQQQKNNQKSPTEIGGLLSPFSQLNMPATAHSCENPFLFRVKYTQDLVDSQEGEFNENKLNPVSSVEDDDITTQRKLLLQKLKKIESRKQQNNFNKKRDNNSWSNELNMCSSYKQGQLPMNQKEYCFTFNDEMPSQKTLTEQSIGGYLLQQQAQQKNSYILSSPIQDDQNASAIKNLNVEIHSMKNELDNSLSANLQLKNQLKTKIQQIEDLQKECQKFNSQQQQQEIQMFIGDRNNTSRSIETVRNTQILSTIVEYNKFIDKLISESHLKDNQINLLKRELSNYCNIINRQKEEIVKLHNIIIQNNIQLNNANQLTSADFKNYKDSSSTAFLQNHLKIIQTEPDLRNEEKSLKILDEREYIHHIQKLQKKIDILQENELNKVDYESQENDGFKTKKNKDRVQIQFQQLSQTKAQQNQQQQFEFEQIPTSLSQNKKEFFDNKEINFERKNSNCSPNQNQKLIQQQVNQIKNNPALDNCQETALICQFSLLESDLFNNPQKNKDFGVINLIEMESFNISPIKNKSYKQDKSTICDKSCLQAILTIEELSQRAQKANSLPPAVLYNSAEKMIEAENKLEDLELKQNNFQNKIKKVLEINTIQQQIVQDNSHLTQQQQQDISPNFYDFIQEIEQNEGLKKSPQQCSSKKNSIQKEKQFLINQKNEEIITNKNKNVHETDAQCQITKNNNKIKDQELRIQFDNFQKQNNQKISNTNNVLESKFQESQRVNSLGSQRQPKYQNLEIIRQYNPDKLDQQNYLEQNCQIQSNKTKSEVGLSFQKGNNKSNQEKQKNISDQITQKIPHTTKESSIKFLFDQSDCSMQFREEINHFNRIIEGKRRSSLNIEQINTISSETEHQNFKQFLKPSTDQSSNSKKFINQNQVSSSNTQQFSILNEQKPMQQQNKIHISNSNQNFSSKKETSDPLNHTENLRFYENNCQSATNHFQDQQQRAGIVVSNSQNLNSFIQRSNRVNSITHYENKHFVGSIVSSSQKASISHINQCGQGNKLKTDSSNSDFHSINEKTNKLSHSQTNNVYTSSTPKGNQEQVSSTSKKKLGGNLANGNSYHIQHKHHDKYDFYYSNSSNNIVPNPASNLTDEPLSNQKSQISNLQYQNDKKNSLSNVQPNNFSNCNNLQNNSNQSNGYQQYQNKILSNKQKKVTGMIVNTITSREYESIGISSTSSHQIRKQIASTVNEAVRNSTQHLQIIQISNSHLNSQSNQQLISQQYQVSTNRNQDNCSIESCSNSKQYEKNNTYEQNVIQQNYHGLQKILNQHINKQSHENKTNIRCPPSNLERLREVKNRIKELNLNNDVVQSQSQQYQQKENLPPTPSTSSSNIINCLFQSNNYNEAQSAQNKSQNCKKIENKSLENPNNFSRRNSQSNNQFSSTNNKVNGGITSGNQPKSDQELVNDEYSYFLKEKFTQKSVQQQKNDDNNFGFKRNSSYNNHHSKNQNQSLESNSRKSESVKRSQKS